MSLKRRLVTGVIGVGLVAGCTTPSSRTSGSSADSMAAASVPEVRSKGEPRDDGLRGLMNAGDTFNLRTVGGVALSSREVHDLPCAERPPVSEALMILDADSYWVERIQEKDCDGVSLDTVGFQSTYSLSTDTVQFYHGDGNEVELGPRAVVTADSLIMLEDRRLAYSRRRAGGE